MLFDTFDLILATISSSVITAVAVATMFTYKIQKQK